MNTNELAYTETIHNRSRRALHVALRRSAADAATTAGSRRFTSNSTISAAKATMVTKKKKSLRTIGPMIAISRLEEGSTPFSESSCSPEMISCAATKNRITVVMRKNFCRLMRTLPFTNITPNTTAAITPSSVPRKLSNSVEFSDTADRISTVSTPSRNTIRNTKTKSPSQAFLSRQQAHFAFDFAL